MSTIWIYFCNGSLPPDSLPLVPVRAKNSQLADSARLGRAGMVPGCAGRGGLILDARPHLCHRTVTRSPFGTLRTARHRQCSCIAQRLAELRQLRPRASLRGCAADLGAGLWRWQRARGGLYSTATSVAPWRPRSAARRRRGDALPGPPRSDLPPRPAGPARSIITPFTSDGGFLFPADDELLFRCLPARRAVGGPPAPPLRRYSAEECRRNYASTGQGDKEGAK